MSQLKDDCWNEGYQPSLDNDIIEEVKIFQVRMVKAICEKCRQTLQKIRDVRYAIQKQSLIHIEQKE